MRNAVSARYNVLACFHRLCHLPEFSSFGCRARVVEERNNHVPLSFASAIEDREVGGGLKLLQVFDVTSHYANQMLLILSLHQIY